VGQDEIQKKKGGWSKEEDEKVKQFVEVKG
jgi:hypothetical protein